MSNDPSESIIASPAEAASHVIHPNSVFDLVSARAILGLKRGCLPREIRLGRLRSSKRVGIRHSSMQITMDYYARVDDALQDAIKSVT
jgi:hypothetical protein